VKQLARAGLVALAFATPQVALAFCPAKTCDPNVLAQHCEVDALTQCVISGESLFWSSNCVTFSIQKDAAPKAGVSYADIEASVKRGFVAWTKADCGGKSPSLRLTLSEPVSCDASEYNLKAKNANVIVFRENEWPYEGAEDALGLTRVRFDTDVNVGELFDTDIELNAVSEPLAVGEPNANEVDLDSLVTHELGHALGLAHSLDSGSTMLAGYTKGSKNARTLGDDDVAGVCETYPPGRKGASSSCEPRHGFSELCGAQQPVEAPPTAGSGNSDDEPNGSNSCAFAPPGSMGTGGASWLLGALSCVGIFWLRRRRASRAVLPMLVALLGLLHAKPASAETQPCFLYVLNNAPSAANAIAGLRVDSSGTPSTVVGSPFATGGSGLATVTGAEYAHRVVVARSTSRLFAANELDGSIAVFDINKQTGALTAVPGSPFVVAEWAGNPGTSLAVSVDGQLLYGSNTSVLSFRVAANGALTQVGARWVFSSRANGTTVSEANDALFLAMSDRVTVLKVSNNGLTGLPPTNYSLGNVPTDVAVNHAGDTLYVGTRSALNAFRVTAGSLTPLAGSPFFSGASNVSGVTLDYYEHALVAYGFSGPLLAAGVVNAGGGITSGLNSPFVPAQAPTGATLSPDGQRLFVSNNAGQVEAWLLDAGTLIHAPGFPVATGAGAGFAKIAAFPIPEPTPSPALPLGLSLLLGAGLFGATWHQSRKRRYTSF
jgi:hypothetical protein